MKQEDVTRTKYKYNKDNARVTEGKAGRLLRGRENRHEVNDKRSCFTQTRSSICTVHGKSIQVPNGLSTPLTLRGHASRRDRQAGHTRSSSSDTTRKEASRPHRPQNGVFTADGQTLCIADLTLDVVMTILT